MGLKELLITIAIVVFVLIAVFEWRICVSLSRNKHYLDISDEEQLNFIKEYKEKREVQSAKLNDTKDKK